MGFFEPSARESARYSETSNGSNILSARLGAEHDQAILAMRIIRLASMGDLVSLRRLKLQGVVDFSRPDYDGRTPLHLAACGGHLDVVRFLLRESSHWEHAQQDSGAWAGMGRETAAEARDRWGNTPLDDALVHEQTEVVDFMTRWKARARAAGGASAGEQGEGRA